jgi:iron(III) transport system substrate-binding protein
MRRKLSRRDLLALGEIGALGVLAAACAPSAAGPASAPTAAAAAPTSAPTAAAPATTAPAQTSGGAAPNWDQLVSAAQAEGKIVVSGPPAPDARTRLPDAFKKRFNIDMEYLAVNSSELASRIQSERAAGQYTMDVSLGGPDTVYGTFLPNKWIDPLKPQLVLPEVIDPTVWPNGTPWFRDPGGDTSLQLFNTISPIGYINTSMIDPEELRTSDDLLNPKWKGKIASYDPSVNGGGLIFGSVVYVTRGADFAKQLYQGQEVAYTRDYQQIADWVAHGSYPIGIGATPIFVAPYQGLPLQQMVLTDIKTIVAGGYGIVSLWNQAPHPNAAKVFANWIASKEGVSTYGAIDGSAPVRTDVDPTAWLAPDLIPKSNGDYFDVFEYKYVTEQRQPISKYYASIKT